MIINVSKHVNLVLAHSLSYILFVFRSELISTTQENFGIKLVERVLFAIVEWIDNAFEPKCVNVTRASKMYQQTMILSTRKASTKKSTTKTTTALLFRVKSVAIFRLPPL